MRAVGAFSLLVSALLSAVMLVWMLGYWSGLGPGGGGLLSELRLADGSEFRLIQRWRFHYLIDFYVKLPGQPWGWCYIEHEDTRWRNGRLKYNPEKQSVEVYRDETLRGEYFTERTTFALYGDWQREVRTPQKFKDPPF